MDWLIFLGLFVIVAIIMAVVGFIGNKAVDGATNAMRSKRVQKQQQAPPRQPQSLAARYQQQGTRAATTSAPVPANTARFCSRCGQPLREGAAFCLNCGAKQGE